jgi:hypothetical protein
MPRNAMKPIWAALLGVLLCHCIFDDRTAGTSTTITNPAPVHGAAIFLDGKPAKGAVVQLRSGDIELDSSGTPRARLVVEGAVDDTGGFSLKMPERLKEYFLVFIQVPPPGDPTPAESVEVQVHPWPDGLPHTGYMGTFRLNKPGSLTGRIDFGDTSADSTRWIGARGTTLFTKVAKDGSFRIDRLAPGRHFLSLVTVPAKSSSPGGTPAFGLRKFAGADSVEAGKVKDMGVLPNPDS